MTTKAISSVYAGPMTRAAALLVDGILFGAVVGAVTQIFGNINIEGVISFLLGVGFQVYFLTRHQGQTPGKMLFGIRVVKTDGSPLTSTDAFIRYLGYALNWLSLGIGWLWAFFDEDSQGWHDKLAKTYVMNT